MELSRESVEALIARLRGINAVYLDDDAKEAANTLTALQARLSEVTGERNAIIEECAKVADRHSTGGDGYYGLGTDDAAANIAEAIRALKAR